MGFSKPRRRGNEGGHSRTWVLAPFNSILQNMASKMQQPKSLLAEMPSQRTYSDAMVRAMRRDFAQGWSEENIATNYRVPPQELRDILERRLYAHVA